MQLDHRPWTEDDAENCLFGLKSDHDFKCLFCGGDMIVHNAKLMEFTIPGGDEKGSKAIDVVLTCRGCGYIDIFGVAVSEEHWAKTKGKILKHLETNPYVLANKKEDQRYNTGKDTEMERDK